MKCNNKLTPYLFCAPFILCYFLFSFFPMIYSFVLSFFQWNGFTDATFVGFHNYTNLLTADPLFWKALKNTIILMAFSTPITVFLGMVVANLLFNIKKGRMFYQTVNFFPYITTAVAIGFIFSYLFDWQTGYINKAFVALGIFNEPYYWLQDPVASKVIIVIMVIWRYLGYYMTIFLAAMTSIPTEIYEAAQVDGATKSKQFFKITIPMLKNTTAFLFITSLIGGLQMFEEPKLLFSGWSASGTTGPDNAGLTVVWKFFNDSFSLDSRLGYGSAIAYTLFMIIVLFTLVGYFGYRRKLNER